MDASEKTGKRNQRVKVGMKNSKWSLFAGYVIFFYIQNPRELTEKLLEFKSSMRSYFPWMTAITRKKIGEKNHLK